MRKAFIIIIFLVGLVTARAQYTDAGAWVGFAVDQKVAKDWNWSLKWENRWAMGGTWHDRGFVNAGVGYRLNKTWRLGAQYRWIERHRVGGFYESGRRFAFRLDGKAKKGPGEWKWRLMTTKAWNPLYKNEGALVTEDLVQRFRLGYAMDLIDRWKLVPSYEIFAKDIESGSVDLSTRIQVQLRHEMSQHLSFGVAYVWSDEWQAVDPWSEHVVRFNVNWRLSDFKARERKKSVPPARVYSAQGQRWSPPRQSFRQCAADQIYVSEVHPKGKPADFIELRNASPNACDLSGFSLTDDLKQEGLVFGITILPSGGCWLGYEEGKGSFSFGISAEAETIYLKNSSGEVRSWEVMAEDVKSSVSFDFAGNSTFSTPSPGRVDPEDSVD
jgi:hypothetical protein